MSPRPQILSLADRLALDPQATGKGVVIAFVDVGFYAHPDLLCPSRRIRAYADVTREAPASDDLFTARATSWHGTMTACVAAGSGYVSGGHYRGLAPEAEVVLIRAADDDGRVVGKHIAAALRFPLRHPELGVRIVNVSLGVSPDDPDAADVDRAVNELVRAGVVVFAAAGNDPSAPPETPGSSRDAITVGGEDDGNTLDTADDAPWASSHGASKPDLLAPAAWLPAPMLPGTLEAREGAALFALVGVLEELSVAHRFGKTDEVDPTIASLVEATTARIAAKKFVGDGHQHVDGTSFAAPIAAAVAAQMLSVNPALTPAAIRRILLETSVALPGVPRAIQGAGVLGPRAAVARARPRTAGLRRSTPRSEIVVERIGIFRKRDERTEGLADARFRELLVGLARLLLRAEPARVSEPPLEHRDSPLRREESDDDGEEHLAGAGRRRRAGHARDRTRFATVLAMPDAYAVHTDACTYLLDDEGVCRFILSPRGDVPADATAAVGAQFVACLALDVPGGLVGDLRVGAMALFAREDEGRHLLLRTTPIRRVEHREVALAVPPDPPTIRIPPRAPRASREREETTLTLVKPLLKRSSVPPEIVAPPPPPRPSRRTSAQKRR